MVNSVEKEFVTMNRTRRPYVGITDFTNFEQVQRMTRVFQKHKHPASTRMLHVGVMMSYKTLHGIESKWSNVFPPKDTIAEIFGQAAHTDAKDLYYCLHYADYGFEARFDDLQKAVKYAGPRINALQLDMTWPHPATILNARISSSFDGQCPEFEEVILQIGTGALQQVDGDPVKLLRRLREYKGVVNRILFDRSMGRGLDLDAVGAVQFIREIKNEFPDLGLVVAGGLGPNTVNLIEPLLEEFPDISIDAQGKLRPSGNILDPIDWNMAETYLISALKLLK